MMTGPTAANTQQQTETFEMRRDFLRWLYYDSYEQQDETGELARALHRSSCIAYDTLRYRESHAWPALVRRKGWKINSDVLMRAWSDWKKARR